jgi:hypothetical protein
VTFSSVNYDMGYFPENAEILAWEAESIPEMTEAERSLYNKLNRQDQLKYLWNGLTASRTAEQLFANDGLETGRGDAFRHAFFSALNAETLGPNMAKMLGDAHENWTGNDTDEKLMEMYNNNQGLKIYDILHSQGVAGDAYAPEASQEILIWVGSGRLQMLDDNGSCCISTNDVFLVD